MSSADRARKLEAFERWADLVEAEDLVVADSSALKTLVLLAESQTSIEVQLVEAVRRARADHQSWSMIAVMLGVSKQTAQRNYGREWQPPRDSVVAEPSHVASADSVSTMSSRTLSPSLAAAVERARTEALAAGELRNSPVEIPPPPLTADELATIADWRSSGDYDRIVTQLVSDDPDLATQ